jgi:hypothetical protein
LAKLAPLVLSFYNRFVIDENTQNELLELVASQGMSAMQACCNTAQRSETRRHTALGLHRHATPVAYA